MSGAIKGVSLIPEGVVNVRENSNTISDLREYIWTIRNVINLDQNESFELAKDFNSSINNPVNDQELKSIIQELDNLSGGSVITGFDLKSLPQTVWLWKDHIPRGHITLVIEAQGSCKSGLAQHFAKVLSKAEQWPDGTEVAVKSKTLWLDAEGAKTLIRDRMIAWGMKPEDLILPAQEDLFADFTITDENYVAISEIIKDYSPALVVVDSLSGIHVKNENKANEMKTLMRQLHPWAAKYNCAVLVVHHVNKKHQLNPSDRLDLDRIRGSSVIAAVARSVLAVDKFEDTDGPNTALFRLYQLKNNLGPPMEGDQFFQMSEEGLDFIDPPKGLLRDCIPMGKREKAQDLIKELLAEGRVPTKEIENKLRDQGISEATSKRAKGHMNVRSVKDCDIWFWELP